MAIYKLCEVADINRGKGKFYKRHFSSNGKYYGLHYGRMYKHSIINSWDVFVDSVFYSENNLAKQGDILLIDVSETLDDLGHFAYVNIEEGLIGNHLLHLRPKVNLVLNKYLFYLLQNSKKDLQKFATGDKVYGISLDNLKKIKIDIPSITHQQKIIDIIEPIESLFIKYSKIVNISNYEEAYIGIQKIIDIIEPIESLLYKSEKLKSKLNRQLHSFSPKGDKVKLSNISEILTGKRNANHSSLNGDYKFFTCSSKDFKCDEYSFDTEALIIAGNGDVGNVKYFNGKFDAYQRTYIVRNCEFIGNAYLALLKSKRKFEQNSSGSVLKFLKKSDIENIIISDDEEANESILTLLKLLRIIDDIIEKLENILKKIIMININN